MNGMQSQGANALYLPLHLQPSLDPHAQPDDESSLNYSSLPRPVHQPLPLPIHVLLDELDVLLGEVAEAALKLEVFPHRRLPLGPDVDGPLLPILYLVAGKDIRCPLACWGVVYSDLIMAQRSHIGEFAEIVGFHSA